MSIVITQEDFLERCKKAHNDEYDYSNAKYEGSSKKLLITCRKHGDFLQAPVKHWAGRGCPACKKTKIGSALKNTKESVIEQFKGVHGDKYNYDLVVYVNLDTKVEIVCGDHGPFLQTPANHRKGKGCPQCAKARVSEAKTISKEVWLSRFEKVHGDRYDYSKFSVINGDTPVEMVCRTHGSFMQSPYSHAAGKGCPSCASEASRIRQLIPQEEAFEKLKSRWKGRYSYEGSTYCGRDENIEVVCHLHGKFTATYGNHVSGSGCPLCGRLEASEKRLLEERLVISRIKKVHGARYNYDNFVYSGMKSKSIINCKKHGDFLQTAEGHIVGYGCPSCATPVSKGEQEVFEFIKSVCPDAVQSDHTVLGKRELDIFVPSKNLAIEFNGVYWHSDKIKDRKYHYNKYRDCRDKGIRLIQFTDVDWEQKKENMKSILLHAVGRSVGDKEKVNARQCEIVEMKAKETKDFYNKNHPQGYASNLINYGLKTKQGEIVAIMSFGFGKTSRGNAVKTATWELSRYATSHMVRGGASKLFKHFIRENNPDEVKSFSMNDWFDGGLYKVLGFKSEDVAPDYRVWHPRSGIGPKSRWQRRSIPKRLMEIGSDTTFEPATDPRTEWKLEDEVGALRIWDSGKTRWIWSKS